ncbi:zinc-binding alcohol dehydrogenase family protein [Mesorhizobium sp. B2-4-6]|uniref:quinone oxidoreductase family protein n=1 Tax=Mesorhizobium sp. B2-4-6 TaxID=2589943 RepID=UPI0011268ED5|nr:zinc-binding alcohol dehydrogenase family protein [Mesorhizobium sp. B2-4-6]TPL43543.1 zinc-binding alcohol dehydrogenase family protein [Mesorhizobium sp. B2-4-6]
MSLTTEHSRHLPVSARGLRLHEKAPDYAAIRLAVEEHPLRAVAGHEVVVEIHAAAVNPSDAKAATGLMPYAVFPRTPGRDYAGKVVVGPEALVGKLVFGSSGDLGIRQDGSHASHLIVEADAVVEVPQGIDARQAAGIGVPFVTAWEGLRRAGLPAAGETVMILGLNGKVGQAAAQIASWRGARVIGVVRREEPYAGHANGPVEVIAANTTDVSAKVRELTGGKGADIVFNTVGDPFYEIGQKSMAVGGRAIFISVIDRFVSFDILAFYKGRHTYVGIDTIALGSVETGAILKALTPGFADGSLRPFPIVDDAVYRFDDAYAAYQAVMGSSRHRVVLVPGG